MKFVFAIIGGGLTGVSMILHFVKRIRKEAKMGRLEPSEINVHMYEKQDTFGPGFPHSEENAMPCHITNMCAQDMGIVSGNPEDFQNWANKHQQVFQNQFGSKTIRKDSDLREDHCVYYPRFVMGEYLKWRFQETMEKARQLGLRVDLHSRCEVVDLVEDCARIRLTVNNLKSGERFLTHADRVLIATGHWFEQEEQNHFFTSPWPAEKLLNGIPEGESVAIIGSSLSALDATLTLTMDGQFHRDDNGRLVYFPSSNPRSIRLYSRNGLLPRVRGKPGGYKNRFLTLGNVERLGAKNNGTVPLKTIFRLLEADLEAACGHRIEWQEILNPTRTPIDLLRGYLKDAKEGDGPNGTLLWQTVLRQTFPLLRRLYANLTAEDRERFDKDYTTLFFSYASLMPLINGEKLLALMESGTVDVAKLGDDYHFIRDDSKGCHEFVYRNRRGEKKRDSYKYVVDARGQKKSFETNPSELAKNLLRSGTVQIEEIPYPSEQNDHNGERVDNPEKQSRTYKTGSIWIDPETHHLVTKGADERKTISETLYAVGAMTRGQIIDASMAYASAVSTAKIAEDIVSFLNRP